MLTLIPNHMTVVVYQEERERLSSCLVSLRLLGKFLGLIHFLPYQCSEHLPAHVTNTCITLRNQVCLATCQTLRLIFLTKICEVFKKTHFLPQFIFQTTKPAFLEFFPVEGRFRLKIFFLKSNCKCEENYVTHFSHH